MKVLLKILKKNVRNSIVCFMSTILTAIILFVFLGVKELVLGTMSMEERVRSQLGIAIQTYMYILLFIGLILISYTVNFCHVVYIFRKFSSRLVNSLILPN